MMTELETRRARIDRIDAALVRLLAARQRQVAFIAGLKAGPDAVRDPKRVAQILAHIGAQARRHGLDEAIAIPLWRELLERSAEAQQAMLRASGQSTRLDEGQAPIARPSRASARLSSMQAPSVIGESA